MTKVLADLCEAIVDCEHKTVPEGDGFALSVGTRAMKNGRLLIAACKPVSRSTYDAWARRMKPQPGDLVLAREAPVGQVIRVPENPRLCLGQRTVLIRPADKRVHPRFLHYWLLGPEAQGVMTAKAGGATVPHLNVEDIRALDVRNLPHDSRVQEFAAETLGALDDLIENNRRRIDLLEQMAQAIYREWFVQFRYPGHEYATFVDSSLGPIPDGWEVARLDQVADVNRASRKPLAGELMRYLDISCLGDRSIGPLAELDGSTAPGRARRVVGPGDVVWSMVRPNRRAHALLVDPGPEWIASTGLAVLSAWRLSPSLLFETVSSRHFSDYLIDLSKIDFDALAARFAGRKRAETDRLAALLRRRAVDAARRNPTRFDLVERIEELIAEYNAGSLNIDEYLRRLIALSQDLTVEEQRAVVEDMTEEELAIFDLLTKPEPVLDDEQRVVVKASSKRLLAHLHDKLVLDWRRKAATTADVRTTIRSVLDADLPADPYPPEVFDVKVQAVFDHVSTAYDDDQTSVYAEEAVGPGGAGVAIAVAAPPNLAAIADEVVERIRVDAEFASLVAAQLGVAGGAALRTVGEIIENDEDFAVEFKSTARWDVREDKPNKAMEDAVVKTVAGFLNTDGGTLLIGVGPDREVVGLGHDYQRVKPPNGDGFVNWLTTHLTNAMGAAAVMRSRARIVVHDGHEICRLDVARSSKPVWARTSRDERVFFVRMNNSTRPLPEPEFPAYLADRWPEQAG